MASKILKTRIQSKFDHISAWNENGGFVPLAGEIVVAYVPSTPETFVPENGGQGVSAPPVQFLLKVGDGTTPLSNLQWITAKAGDVWGWAKKEHLDWNDLSATGSDFLEHLSAYIQDNSKNAEYTLSSDLSSVAGNLSVSLVMTDTKDGQTNISSVGSFVDSITISSLGGSGEYAASYQLIRNNSAVGDPINIPKDFIVKEATVRTILEFSDLSTYAVNELLINSTIDYTIYRVSSAITTPSEWSEISDLLDPTNIQTKTEYDVSAGQKVIDLEINTKSGTVEGSDHVYIPVKDIFGDELDSTVSADASSTDPSSEFFNVVSGVAVSEEDGVLDSLSVKNAKLNKIALSGNANYLTQEEGDFLILYCGSATELIDLVTIITFEDGTRGSYDFEGELDLQTLIDAGLCDQEEGLWIKQPTNVQIGSKVTSIGDGIFENCTNLASVTIPGSVTNIGEGTFENCTNLTFVTIPNSVTSIRNDVFSGCESLISITIPNSVTSIGSGAFYGCESLKSITIPNGVQLINHQTFNGCTNLSSVTIPNSVTTISGAAFANCESLKSITIPESVETIATWAFIDCTIEITMSGKTISDVERLNYRSWSCKSGSVIHCTDGDIQIQ